MKNVLRCAVFLVSAGILSGCKAVLTNRIEVQNDASVIMHVMTRVDDQMYSFGTSQASVDWGKAEDSADGWSIKRYVTADGDHVIDASKHVASIQDAGAAIAEYYQNDLSNLLPSTPSTTLMRDPSDWHFAVEERRGFFTKIYHVQADIPRLMPANIGSPSFPGMPYGAPGMFGDQMAARMFTSVVRLSTEIKVPGKILSTNGEWLSDGSIRFMHPLTANSHIDLVNEVPDVMLIAIAALFGCSILAFVIVFRMKNTI